MEHQALCEIKAFTEETAANIDVEEGEIPEEETYNKSSKVVDKSTLDINEFIKRQEELNKRQQYAKSLQVSEKSKLAAERISKQVKRKRKKQICNQLFKKSKLNENKAKEHESDSDYEPSEEISDGEDCCDSVNIPRRRQIIDYTNSEKVKDDGSLNFYKTRLEEYYKRLEEEKAILNGNDEEGEFHVIKGGLKVPVGIWNNLYR